MGVIFKVTDKNGGIWGYYSCDSQQEISSAFQKLEESESRIKRAKNGSFKCFPVFVEETEDVNRRLAFYSWPQLSRLEYSESCFNYPIDRKYNKRVYAAINWCIRTFPEDIYSFRLETIEQYHMHLYVYKNGELLERYGFEENKVKEPSERTFF